MRILVDSNVLSELTKPAPDENVIEWLRRHEADLVVNPIILGEIEYGILIMPAGHRRARMEEWFDRVIQTLESVDLDKEAATAWARLLADLKERGLVMPVKDSLIAATALARGFKVATRNTADFKNAGVPLENPFSH